MDKREHDMHPLKGGSRRSIIMLSVLIAVLVLCIFGAVLPQMYIERIEVTGLREIPEEALLSSTGLVKGEHLFRNIGGGIVQILTFRYGNIENKLRDTYPYIGDIRIQISFPSCVRITVDERKKIGYVNLPDGYAVIDTEGCVVEMSDQDVPAGVPLMQGLPVKSAVLGKKIGLSDTKGLNRCITVLGAVIAADENRSEGSDFLLMPCITEIRSVESGTTFLSICLPSNQKDMLVRLGSLTGISGDMNWLRYAVGQNVFDNVGDGVLDMSGEDNTFRPVA